MCVVVVVGKWDEFVVDLFELCWLCGSGSVNFGLCLCV